MGAKPKRPSISYQHHPDGLLVPDAGAEVEVTAPCLVAFTWQAMVAATLFVVPFVIFALARPDRGLLVVAAALLAFSGLCALVLRWLRAGAVARSAIGLATGGLVLACITAGILPSAYPLAIVACLTAASIGAAHLARRALAAIWTVSLQCIVGIALWGIYGQPRSESLPERLVFNVVALTVLAYLALFVVAQFSTRLRVSLARTRRLAETLHRLQHVNAELARNAPMDDVAAVLISEGKAAIDATAAALHRYAPEGHALVLVSEQGFTDRGRSRYNNVPLSAQLPVSVAARTRTPVWLPDLASFEQHFPIASRQERDWYVEDIAIVSLPLLVGERLLGALTYIGRARIAFSDDERAFFTTLSYHAAQALERIRLFDEERRMQDRLRSEQQLIQIAYERARLAERRKDEFIALLGHELRNPLAPILAAVELMQKHGDVGSKRERAVIERQVMHLARLVDDLLDVSRIATGKTRLEWEETTVERIIGDAIEMVRPQVEERRHHLVVEGNPKQLHLRADPGKLAQVIANLLTNAAKYTDPGGQIELRVGAADDEIRIDVKDTGMGISADTLPRLFAPFEQAPQSLDRARGGLGLGLALVRGLVELHGGHVEAKSDGLGKGSTFTVWVPGSHTASAPQLGRARQLQKSERRGRRVMVVDDNRDAAEMTAALLHDASYEVAIAHDGAQALELFDKYLPSAAIIDIGLPILDGYELGKRLRQRKGSRAIRLVALTGYGQAADRRRSLAAGFDVHLTKPVSRRELLAALGEEEARA